MQHFNFNNVHIMHPFKRVVCVHPRLARIGFFTGMPRDSPLSVCLSVCLSRAALFSNQINKINKN